ncbi:myosin-2 heavy chain-like isoform X1 [Sycon ciliatum]|uniref:myosin-2 heavy chain-like isoform X1 n=1 Tax=Sycon ciliatum TaxID=27933 RepID=UPI0031F6D6F3
MGPLLLPGVVLAIVVAFGAILWYLFKSAEADSTPFYPDDNEGSDGGSETSKNRTKKRPFQPRRRNRERTTHPVEETPQAARLEERNTHAGANVAKSATTTAKKPAGERSPPARKGAAAAAPTPTIAPTSHPVSRQASDPVLPGKSRKVSFSEDAVTEAAGQETRTTAVPTASSNGVSPPSVPSAKANKAAAKSSSSTKVKNPAKSKPSRSAASASVASNVDELARAIERANLSASDAQELVDVLLSASSGGASEWMSRGSHGRTEETLESVRKARTELAAQLEEERAAHRSLLASSKDRRAESIEEMRQMKFKLEAVQKGFAQKTKEAANALARVRSMEEELDAKSALPATAEAGRYIAEINHLKSELEGANTRLASSMADSNNVKQAAKNTEATLNNQLQQAKSNAERQQKRARDLEKQLQSEPKAGVEATAVQAQNDELRQRIATVEAGVSEQIAAVESSKSKELVALEKKKAEELVALEKKKAEEVVALEKKKAEELVALEKKKAEELAAVEKNLSVRIADLEKSKQELVTELQSAKTASNGHHVEETQSADPALVTEKDEEISKLKKSLESWKTDAKKFEERLLASNAKNAELRETTWRAKDEAALAQKNAKAEVKKSIDGFKAKQREETSAERDAVTKELRDLCPSVEVSSDCKTLTSWVQSFVEKAGQEKASTATSASSSSAESTEELERSRERLSAAEAEVESLKSRCEEAEEVLAQTTSTLAGIQSQVEAEDDKHMDKLQSLEADFDRVEASKKKLQEQLDSAETELAQAKNGQKQIHSLRKELEQSKNVNDDMQKFLQQTSTRHEGHLKESAEKLRRAESQLSSSKSRMEVAEQKAKAAEEALAKHRSEQTESTTVIEQLRKDIETSSKERESLQSRCAEQETALQAARQEVEEAAKEKRTSVDDVNQMVSSLNELQTAMSKLEVEKQELAEQLRNVLNASASASTDV